MSSMQNYLKTQLNAHVLRTGSFTKPSNLYLALYATKPDKDGANGVEVSATEYSRISCGPLDANWDAPDATGKSTNQVDFTFPDPDGVESWGTIVAVGICDADTGGNILLCDDLTQSVEVVAGGAGPIFKAGSISLTWS